jgi:hypothetical protein
LLETLEAEVHLTNRDIYKMVTGFSETVEKQSMPSLEKYLSALWSVVSQEQDAPLTAEKFVEWLEKAFVTPAPDFNPDWLQRKSYNEESSDFQGWEDLIVFQIADLRRMDEAGALQDEYRYYGIDSPSGSRWYNFDPLTYLECGVRGALGGYTEDEVIVLIPPAEGESAGSPVFEVQQFSWDTFKWILQCGQQYE